MGFRISPASDERHWYVARRKDEPRYASNGNRYQTGLASLQPTKPPHGINLWGGFCFEPVFPAMRQSNGNGP